MFLLKDEPLNLNDVIALVKSNARGGLVTFSGVIREVESNSSKISHLFYSAHHDMAVHQMKRIAVECETKWPGVVIAAQHRLGIVPVGEIAVVVACAGVHRREAFEACAYFMDRLKQDVPIFKERPN
jgi:molybdopterin synthase catalytic subunit